MLLKLLKILFSIIVGSHIQPALGQSLLSVCERDSGLSFDASCPFPKGDNSDALTTLNPVDKVQPHLMQKILT